jgi:ectoine hydroxylase-related dioxygenase (phytanoyl-CoA dioxygenase family)
MRITEMRNADNQDSPADSQVFAASSAAAIDPLQAIRRLDLDRKVSELDVYGYTIIEPTEFDGRGLAPRLRDAVLRQSARGTSTHSSSGMALGETRFYVLLEDPVFEEALMHEVPLSMVSYLLGESCLLSSLSTAIRGPGTPALGLHTDMILAPSPFPAYAQVANVFWALTDLSPEGGSTFFWPGSHKFCRRPTVEECADSSKFVPITAPAGSIVVWHGNTWHGAGAKNSPGLRITMPMFFCRSYFIPQESYREKVSAAALARNPPRFAHLLGVDHPYPFARSGPDFQCLGRANALTETLFG